MVVTTLVSILLPSIGLNQVPWNELDLPDFTTMERVYLLICIVSKFDQSGKGVIICLYINDMLIFGTDQVQVDLTKDFLSSMFSMKDMGKADVILGLRIKHESNGIIVSQSHYIEKELKKFNYFDCTPVSSRYVTRKKTEEYARIWNSMKKITQRAEKVPTSRKTRSEEKKLKNEYERREKVKIARYDEHSAARQEALPPGRGLDWIAACRKALPPGRTTISVKPKVLAPGKYAIDVEPIPPHYRNNREVHLVYLMHLKESVDTLREIVEEAKVERPLDRSLAFACRYTKHSQELLEYVFGTCPKVFNQQDKKHAHTPRKKQVTFEDQIATSSNTTHKHVEPMHTQQSNVPVPPSTGVNSCTDASGSQPRSILKKHRIPPAKSDSLKKVEDHLRTIRSSLKTTNRVDSSISSKRTVINSNSHSVCQTCNKCLFSANHDMCVVTYLHSVNASPNVKNDVRHDKQVWKPKQVTQVWKPKHIKQIWKPTGKTLNNVGYQWRPTGRTFTLSDQCPLTRFTKLTGMSAIACANQSEPNQHWGSNFPNSPSSSVFKCRSYKSSFVRFGNDHFGAIMGYGDYVIGDSVISRVYYVEGLGHNLFSVGQFCDSDLEVAFRKHSCYVRDTDGVELLKGSRGSNLYTISVEDMMKSSPICLLSKASKHKSWLWHRRLNHLNFGTINDLARKDLVRGLPRLKFEKDHLCSACQLGKSKKHTHKPKTENTNLEVLNTLHMDLCGPMRVQTINGKKYILVIVDDYSRFTWVKFLRSKDETPTVVIKFLKQIQVGLNKTVRFIRTDNGTEFVNKTLYDYYESVGIFHQKTVPRTPQQNGVVERRNRTLVEAARTMLIFSPRHRCFFGDELVATVLKDCWFQHARRNLEFDRLDLESMVNVYDQNKARLVANGFRQEEGLDFDDILAQDPWAWYGHFVKFLLASKGFSKGVVDPTLSFAKQAITLFTHYINLGPLKGTLRQLNGSFGISKGSINMVFGIRKNAMALTAIRSADMQVVRTLAEDGIHRDVWCVPISYGCGSQLSDYGFAFNRYPIYIHYGAAKEEYRILSPEAWHEVYKPETLKSLQDNQGCVRIGHDSKGQIHVAFCGYVVVANAMANAEHALAMGSPVVDEQNRPRNRWRHQQYLLSTFSNSGIPFVLTVKLEVLSVNWTSNGSISIQQTIAVLYQSATYNKPFKSGSKIRALLFSSNFPDTPVDFVNRGLSFELTLDYALGKNVGGYSLKSITHLHRRQKNIKVGHNITLEGKIRKQLLFFIPRYQVHNIDHIPTCNVAQSSTQDRQSPQHLPDCGNLGTRGRWSKRVTAKGSKRLVDEFVDEGVPAAKPLVLKTQRRAILQKVLQRKFNRWHTNSKVGSSSPCGYQVNLKWENSTTPEVPWKGERESRRGTSCHFSANLQTPKRRARQNNIYFKRHLHSNVTAGREESSSLYAELGLSGSDTESDEEMLFRQAGSDPGTRDGGQAGLDHGTLDEGQAGSDPGTRDEGQAGSNPGTLDEGQAGSDPGDTRRTCRSTGNCLFFKHLAKDFSFGDQFLNDKPSEADNEKTTADTEAESMASVTIQQDTSITPPMTSPVIDLVSRPHSPNVHWPLPTTTITTAATTTTTLFHYHLNTSQGSSESLLT
ncbi:retrovirus-related pol polyprotein from transposon TNT 1-94 [Tanacetum coccineum]